MRTNFKDPLLTSQRCRLPPSDFSPRCFQSSPCKQCPSSSGTQTAPTLIHRFTGDEANGILCDGVQLLTLKLHTSVQQRTIDWAVVGGRALWFSRLLEMCSLTIRPCRWTRRESRPRTQTLETMTPTRRPRTRVWKAAGPDRCSSSLSRRAKREKFRRPCRGPSADCSLAVLIVQLSKLQLPCGKILGYV